MKADFKQFITQLSDALELNVNEGEQVVVLVDNDGNIVGWNVADVDENENVHPQFDTPFKNLKELINWYK